MSTVIIIPKAETCDGEVTENAANGKVSAGSGPEYAEADKDVNPNWLRNRAINLLNIADYIENRRDILCAKEIEARTARNKRRDELAREMGYGDWIACDGRIRRAIDRIIELEAAK